MAYSKKLLDFFKAQGIKEGDRVRAEKGGIVYAGMLMPRAAGDENALVLKLDSGYNVGVSFSEKMVLEKLPAKSVAVKAEKPVAAKHKAGLPKLAIVATGGTIVSKVDYKTGGVYALEKPEELIRQFPDLLDACELRKISSPFTVMSEDISSANWIALAKEVSKELKESDSVIVTHGTDALGYSAAALSFMIATNKTVALVGAQRSPDRGSFDGAMNLVCAAHFASKAHYPGVAVVMHGSSSDDFCYAHKGTKVRKMHSSRRDAFQTINGKPLAKIYSDGRIEEMAFEAKKAEEGLDAVFEEKVSLIKAYPNSDPAILDWLIENGNRGILIEAMGLGHVPTNGPKSWIPHVAKAVDKGVFVGITTQTLYGAVNPLVYSNLRKLSEAGAVFLEDGLPETMYVKLGWVLAHPKWNAKEKMLENLRGEFNPRLKDSDFRLPSTK
ncbi:TPA: Glu-tRNA(Gln) amidotransferase subunit GatD [Candidatus Micrarchaeota archaeon]|nr:Glu-tRNA(Gln) amidotransferase subunit GatD [Candidatus Micrarchaeota archaeon]